MAMLRERLKRFLLLGSALAVVGLLVLLVYHVLMGGASPWVVIIGWAIVCAGGVVGGLAFFLWLDWVERRRRG